MTKILAVAYILIVFLYFFIIPKIVYASWIIDMTPPVCKVTAQSVPNNIDLTNQSVPAGTNYTAQASSEDTQSSLISFTFTGTTGTGTQIFNYSLGSPVGAGTWAYLPTPTPYNGTTSISDYPYTFTATCEDSAGNSITVNPKMYTPPYMQTVGGDVHANQ